MIKLFTGKICFDFVVAVMQKLDVTEENAKTVADNLVLANLRGVDSHGVARLSRYVDGIKTGYIIPKNEPVITKQTCSLANVDARNGLGQVAGKFGMELALQKAKKEGMAYVTVFNSNHFGIAGYYALMALKEDFIGISMTNSAPLVVPTYSKNAIFGTNPIAVAAPTNKNLPWVMDSATSVAPRGKVELYNRLGKPLPAGWATDETGRGTSDAARVLKNLADQLGGGLLPLGGESEELAGHKGYGLIVMVDILTSVISGSNFGPDVVSKKNGQAHFPRVGHMFMAIDPEYFVGKNEFKNRMDSYIDLLKNSEKAEGAERIWVHGEKEYEEQEYRSKKGLPLDAKTVESLDKISKDFSVELKYKS